MLIPSAGGPHRSLFEPVNIGLIGEASNLYGKAPAKSNRQRGFGTHSSDTIISSWLYLYQSTT